MNFDLDDPLGDLLSDGSNDSFYEKGTTKAKKTETPKTPLTSNDPSKAKLENLFGIGDGDSLKPTTMPQSSGPSSLIGMGSGRRTTETSKPQPKKPVPVAPSSKPSTFKKEIKFEDDDDNSSLDLGFDPRKPKSGKKSNILDDLLGIGTDTKESSIPSKIPSKPKTPPVSNIARTESGSRRIQKQTTFDKTDTDDVPTTGNSSRPRPLLKRDSSISVNDPLGLFSHTNTPATTASNHPENLQRKEQKTPTKKGSTMDWLGLRDEPESEKPESNVKPSEPQHQSLGVQEPVVHPSNLPNFPYQQPMYQEYHPPSSITQTASMIAATNIEAETALQSLKQQETQLMIAAQMRNQETVLLEMQRKQQQLLQQQESHFNDLFQKQMQRQTALEMSIRRQQDRLNSHIQVLMSQPNSLFSGGAKGGHLDKDDADIGDGDNDADGSDVVYGHLNEEKPMTRKVTEIQLRAEVKALELEKLRLEDLVQNMKVNHEQELDFLEQSHKKQLQVLEGGMEKLEQRLKEENQNLVVFYRKKIETVEEEKKEISENSDKKIKEMEGNYGNILAKLKAKYEDDLENLKTEHKNMIETLRESKLLEFSLVQENSSYLQTLKNATNYLENASDTFQNVKDDLHEKITSIHQQKETELAAAEKRLKVQQEQIDRSKEAAESERSRLLDLVRSLETKLNTLSQTSTEEQWNLRQQQAILEAERASFERERSFAREQIGRDEKRIENLKAQQITEYQRMQKQIDDERETILLEKSKLEMMTRLQKPADISTAKAEIESAIKIAQDATRQSDLERERYLEMQRQHELKKRQLIDQENQIRSKELELELAIKASNAQEKNAEAASKSAKYVENQLQSKIQFLQQSFRDLTLREQKLAEDKITLSRERLELQSIRQKVFQSKCSLCKIGERNQELSDIISKTDRLDNVTHQMPNLDIAGLGINSDQFKYQDALDIEVRSSLNRMENMKPFHIDLSSTDFGDVPNIENSVNDLVEPDVLLARINNMKSGRFFE